ncbi:MAG: TlpA family protein disulfide reductase [Melioribacteraceae bacterium]|nr:MAG: TlpA family protein disulfide reductase [Melioribacteraceae bacterium]
MNKHFWAALFIFFITFMNLINAQDQIEFTIELLNGDEVEFSKLYKDGPVLVNFWALWCKPCRTEMKYLKAIYEKYSEQGFKILGINQDTPKSLSKVNSFVESYDLKYLIGLDPNKKYFEMFNGQVLPFSILYNKNGEVVYMHTGYLPGDEIKLEEAVKKVLENKQ